MNKTNIEYLTHTWNPIAMRCTPVSDGCAHCWHIRMAKRHAGNWKLSTDIREAKAGGPPILLASELEAPLRQRTPARIGVQFMGDLFHRDVPFEFIERVFESMYQAPQHTYQILTKRSSRMADCIKELMHPTLNAEAMLSNIQLGTSAENQAMANLRIPHLIRCPAAVRLLSLEPLLGEVDLSEVLSPDRCPSCCDGSRCTLRAGHRGSHFALRPTGGWATADAPSPSPLHWVIVGGESGPGARPCKPNWVRSVRDQCAAAGVPFFFKGWGDWAPEEVLLTSSVTRPRAHYPSHVFADDVWMFRVGKKKAGNLLDGQRHQAWPEGA